MRSILSSKNEVPRFLIELTDAEFANLQLDPFPPVRPGQDDLKMMKSDRQRKLRVLIEVESHAMKAGYASLLSSFVSHHEKVVTTCEIERMEKAMILERKFLSKHPARCPSSDPAMLALYDSIVDPMMYDLLLTSGTDISFLEIEDLLVNATKAEDEIQPRNFEAEYSSFEPYELQLSQKLMTLNLEDSSLKAESKMLNQAMRSSKLRVAMIARKRMEHMNEEKKLKEEKAKKEMDGLKILLA